jgi:hypothetical protein
MDRSSSPGSALVGPPGCRATLAGEETNGSRLFVCLLLPSSAVLATAYANIVRGGAGLARYRDGSMRGGGVARNTNAQPENSPGLSLVACFVHTARVDRFLRA